MAAAWAAASARLQTLRRLPLLVSGWSGASGSRPYLKYLHQRQRLGYQYGEGQHFGGGGQGLHTTAAAWLEAGERRTESAGDGVSTPEPLERGVQQRQGREEQQQQQQVQQQQEQQQLGQQQRRRRQGKAGGTKAQRIKQLGEQKQWEEVLRLTIDAPAQGSPEASTHVLVAALQAMGRCGRREEAMRLLEHLEAQKQKPAPPKGYNGVINAYAHNGDWRGATRVLERMRGKGVCPDVFAFNTAIKACVPGRRTLEACALLRECIAAKRKPDAVTYNTLIDLHAKAGDMPAVLECMRRARAQGLRLNGAAHHAALHACSKAKPAAWQTALQIWGDMKAAGVIPFMRSWNCLLDALGRGQQLGLVMEQLEAMKDAGHAPDAITYVLLINGFALAGDTQQAQALFDEAVHAGVAPTQQMYGALINAYAAAGDVAGAKRVCEQVPREHRSVIVHSTVVKAYCNAGDLDGARAWVERMREDGIEPNDVTRRTIKFAERNAGKAKGS